MKVEISKEDFGLQDCKLTGFQHVRWFFFLVTKRNFVERSELIIFLKVESQKGNLMLLRV